MNWQNMNEFEQMIIPPPPFSDLYNKTLSVRKKRKNRILKKLYSVLRMQKSKNDIVCRTFI